MSPPINPYIAGIALRGVEGFYGRQDIIGWVTQELRRPTTNSLVLFGQRRIGKTSLLLQLRRLLAGGEFFPVYFDLQDQAKCRLGEVLANLAETACESAGGEPYDESVFDEKGRFFQRTFLPRLYELLGRRRPVFLFDEFDVLDQSAEAELTETTAAKGLFDLLRRVMTEDPRPAFVFVVGRRADDLSLDLQATFKTSLSKEVWVLDRPSAEALVRQAEANGTLHFSKGSLEEILEVTDGHPYLTQLLCQRIWQKAYSGEPASVPHIDVHKVAAAIPDALSVGDQALAWLWGGLGPAEKIYAAAFAELAEKESEIPEDRVIEVLTTHAARLRTREVELAPRDLVRRRILEKTGDSSYRFAVDLIRRWVRKNKPLSQVKDELDRIEPEADLHFHTGQEWFRRRKWDLAIRSFEDALKTNPHHFEARLQLGEAWFESGEITRAVLELEKACELDRERSRLSLARVLTSQARQYLEEGLEEEALTVCDRILELSPGEKAAREIARSIWTGRGELALERDDLDGALWAYQKAQDEAQVDHVEWLLRKRLELEALEREARDHDEAGRWAEARELYRRLVSDAPDENSRAHWLEATEALERKQALARSAPEDETAHPVPSPFLRTSLARKLNPMTLALVGALIALAVVLGSRWQQHPSGTGAIKVILVSPGRTVLDDHVLPDEGRELATVHHYRDVLPGRHTITIWRPGDPDRQSPHVIVEEGETTELRE